MLEVNRSEVRQARETSGGEHGAAGDPQELLDQLVTGRCARCKGICWKCMGVEVSPEFISGVTDAVMAEVTAWQGRALEPMYPVVFFDALRVKIGEDAVVRNKAVYLALGVLPDGTP